MNARRYVSVMVATMGWTLSSYGQLQWDTNTATAGAQGGTGNWLAPNLWFTGTSNVSWLDGSSASFGIAPGTVTVNGPVTANALTFTTGGYTIDGSAVLTLGGSAPSVSVPTATDSATISAPIAGSAGLTKAGAGTLTLSGTNTFTGAVVANAGAISVASLTDSGVSGPLGAGTSLTFNGGKLTYTASPIESTNRSISLLGGGGGFEVTDFSTSVTLSGVISGPGSLIKTGPGTLGLQGVNTFTGNVAIDGGQITVTDMTNSGVAGQLGAGSSITMNGGTLFPIAASDSTNRPISLGTNGGVIGAGGVAEFSGPITGGGTGFSLQKIGTGTLILSGTNTFTGNVFVGNRTLRVANGNAIPDMAGVDFNSNVLLPVLDLNNSNETIGSLGANTGGSLSGGAVTLGSGTLTVGTNNRSTTFTGVISGTNGNLTKIGTGTLTLPGASTFTGTVAINGGTLSVPDVADSGAASPLGAGSSVSFDGGTLLLTATANDTMNRSIILNAGGGTFVGSPSAILTLSGVISGPGGFTRTGSGGTHLTAVNTFTGPITAGGAFLSVESLSDAGVPSAIGAGNSIVLSGGALVYSGFGTFSTNRPVNIVGGGSLGPGNGTITFSGPITGTGGLGITGPGILVLSGTNTYTGNTSTSNSLIRILNGNAIPDGSEVFAGSSTGSGLDLANSNETIGSLRGGNALGGHVTLGSSTLTTGGANTSTTYDGVISGTGGVVKVGSGTMTLTRASSFSGSLTIQNGAVSTPTIGGAGEASPLGAGNSIALGAATSVGTLVFTSPDDGETNRSFALNGMGGGITVSNALSTLTLDGPVSGAGGLTKAGPGTLVLALTPNYPGPTNINAGTLTLFGGLDSAGGPITIASGGTLRARNVVNRAITGGGTITAIGGLIIGSASTTNGFAFDGTLNIGTNQVVLDDGNMAQLGTSTTFDSGGRLTSFNGITLEGNRIITVAPGASASLSGSFINNGSVTGPTTAGQVFTFANSVTGAGSYGGNILFAGSFSPGNSGIATVSLHSFSLTSATTLSIDLASPSQHDRLNFTGAGLVDGVLNVTLLGGFQPAEGNSFTLLSGGALSGAFDSINLPGLPSGLAWSYNQTSSSATLVVIPEPSAAAALLLAAAGLIAGRMRRNRQWAV